MTEFRSEG